MLTVTAERPPHLLPRCEHTDLPRLQCGCPEHAEWAFDYDDLTDAERAWFAANEPPEPTHHLIPLLPYRLDYDPARAPKVTLGSGAVKTASAWAEDVPRVIDCDHGHDDQAFICRDCLAALTRMLGDVPALVSDLEAAVARDVSFVQQGAPVESDPEESSLPFNDRASEALAALWRALRALPGVEPGMSAAAASHAALARFADLTRHPDLPAHAARVSGAVRQAHQAVERPPTLMHYGPCPLCTEDIRHERVHDPRGLVSCQSCDYTATLAEHQASSLEAGRDRKLTPTELVAAFTQGGRVVTRPQIEAMIRSGGLPRETRNRPSWRDGVLVDREVYVYRVGDVADALDGQDETRGYLTTQQVAAMLRLTEAGVRKLVERKALAPARHYARPLRFNPADVDAYLRGRAS